jgi:hypothetical protein
VKTFKELMIEGIGDSEGLRDVSKIHKGQDQEDLEYIASLIAKNDLKGIKGFLKSIDTEIRDIALAHIDQSNWKKLGFNPIKEGTNPDPNAWMPGDGKPMTGSKIGQVEYWDLPNDELKKIVSKAKKYIKDLTHNDYRYRGNRKRKDIEAQQNDIYDAGEVLHWRKRNKIVVN